MKPKVESDESELTTSEIPLKLIYHPKTKITLDLWDIENDEPASTTLECVNIRAGTHLLDVVRINRDVVINGKKFWSMQTFLDRCGLKATGDQIRKWLSDAYRKYGSTEWIRCCLYSASVHGICEPQEDYLLIQSHSEAWLKPDGMFIIPKAKKCNAYFESVGSNKRFVKSYVKHKVI